MIQQPRGGRIKLVLKRGESWVPLQRMALLTWHGYKAGIEQTTCQPNIACYDANLALQKIIGLHSIFKYKTNTLS